MHEKSQGNPPNWLLKAREKWQFNGRQRPPFAEIPEDGQVSVWDFPRPPAVEKVTQSISVFHEDLCLAKTSNGYAVMETASPPTYYIPLSAVNKEHLVSIPHKTSVCEWKGSAQYWALANNPQNAIAWSYAKPFSPFEKLKDYFAFYPQQLTCFLGDEKVRPQPGLFYAGWITNNLAGPFKGDPGTGHW